MRTWLSLPLLRVVLAPPLRAACLGAAVAACAGTAPVVDEGGAAGTSRGGKADGGGDIRANWRRGVASTHLDVDFGALTAQARLTLDPPASPCDADCTASFEAGGLRVTSVHADGAALPYEQRDGALHVLVGAADALTIHYALSVQSPSEGLGPAGSTSVWPTFCGNLFPCHSDPADGMTFGVQLTGVPDGQTALVPPEVTTETPAYTLAFAVGPYSCEALGATPAGTQVSVCWIRKVGGGANSAKSKALDGTRALVGAFGWLEAALGPYAFGDRVASVAADWGDGAAGGMEHHPYWHVAISEMADPLTHAHEAAHGWFGAGVRIACWEDLVLSEGTVSYLAARARGASEGPDAEAETWASYEEELAAALDESGDYVVLPDTCGEVDVLEGLWSNVLYMKGAFFFRDYGDLVGHDVLVAALGGFYRDHVGTAARTRELLDALTRATGVDAAPLAERWLTGLGNPLAPKPE